MTEATQNVDLESEVLELSESGKNRGQIEGYLKWAHDMSNKDARNFVHNVLGKGTTSSANWSDTIRFIREKHGILDKGDLVAGMMEIKGAKQSSMEHAYNYIKFAQEYSRQEVEAAVEALIEKDDGASES